jgi:hypothetical protein
MDVYGSGVLVTILIIFIGISLFTIGLTLVMIHLLVKGKVRLQVTPEPIFYPGAKALKKMCRDKEDDPPFMIIHEKQKKPDLMCSTIPMKEDK